MNDVEVIGQIFGSKDIEIKQIEGKGEVNRVYLVELNKKKMVIRINDEDELPRFKKEAWCMKEAAKKGINCTKTIKTRTNNGHAFMILDYVSGINGKEIIKNKEYIWQIIGSYAKKLNSISTDGFGENMTAPGIFSDNWERYLNYNIESLNSKDKLLSLGIIDGIQSKSIKEKFIRLNNVEFDFGLIHGDLSLENVIVEGNKITLIDWGCAESNIVPHMEIVDLLQNGMSENTPMFGEFLKGYGMSRQSYDLIKAEIKTLTLLQAVDKLRWAIDRNPNKTKEFADKVKLILAK